MGDDIDMFGGEEMIDEGSIADISLDKPKILPTLQLRQVFPVSRVGERIQNHYPVLGIATAPIADKIRPDKPSRTSHQKAAG